MTAPVFVVSAERLVAGTVVVDGAEGHHAARVRRLRVGENVALVDGAGRRADGTVEEVRRDAVVVTVGQVTVEPQPAPRIVVVQALPKGDRAETAVEAMTEVGVDVIVPWASERCVVRWDGERAEKGRARWEVTAREAAKQARRARFPDIAPLATTAGVVERVGGAAFAAVLHEAAVEPLAGASFPAAGDVVLVIGPEGGLAEDEVTTLTEAGGSAYRLGPSVLRTSTAGVVAASIVLAATRWSSGR